MDDDDIFDIGIGKYIDPMNVYYDDNNYHLNEKKGNEPTTSSRPLCRVPPEKGIAPDVRYRIPLEVGAGVRVHYRVPAPATGSNTVSDAGIGNAVAVAVALAAVLGLIALCLHIWFNILPIKG